MLVIATGISGCGRKNFLNKFEKFAEKKQKSVKVFNIGEMLLKQAKKIKLSINLENVLNTNPHVISSLRSAVFENVLSSLSQDLKKYDVVIINVHSFFFWKKIFSRAYDQFYIRKMPADLFVTFIDDPKETQERINARKQWVQEKLTLDEVLLWENVEVETTSLWAEIAEKPFYVMPVAQPISSFYQLLFHPQQESVYISMPLTHLQEKETTQRINKFIQELNKYFLVFDPRAITKEVGAVKLRKKVKNPIFYHQIVNRDLYWLIKQSKKIVAFFPKVVSSPGVINEFREAHETNKTVWVIYPGGIGSPFVTYFCDQVFNNEKEFFSFLKKNYRPIII